MQKIIFVIALSVFSLMLTGCTTSRDYISLNKSISPKIEVTKEKVAYVDVVSDNRIFEEKPRNPSTPSLKGGLENASLQDREHAIGRKRDGFGKAWGDIMLKDETVAELIKKHVESELIASGYRVVNADEKEKADLSLNIKVNKFWTWLNPGFFHLTITTEVDITIADKNNNFQTENIYAKKFSHIQIATIGNYKKNITNTLDEFDNKLLQVFK